MIMGDKIAQMGPNAWAVYSVLKAYTNFESGQSSPSQERIAGHIGASVDTVGRALDRLIELKVVEKKRVGRHNEYRLMESFPIRKKDDQGTEVATASDFYRPKGFQSLVEQLRALAKTGDMPKGATFHIQVNVISQGDNSSVHVGDVVMGGKGVDGTLVGQATHRLDQGSVHEVTPREMDIRRLRSL
jgi:hypothetical protein